MKNPNFKTILRTLLSTLLFFTSFWGWSQDSEGITVSGVLHSDGTEIEVGMVSFKHFAAATDLNGQFELFIPLSQKADSITLEVDAFSYHPQNVTLSWEDVQKPLEFNLRPYGELDADSSRADISRGNPKFFLSSGFAPMSYFYDSIFEKRYGVHFHELGCELEGDLPLSEYNSVTANYLDSLYGKQWRNYVRPDVKGAEITPYKLDEAEEKDSIQRIIQYMEHIDAVGETTNYDLSDLTGDKGLVYDVVWENETPKLISTKSGKCRVTKIDGILKKFYVLLHTPSGDYECQVYFRNDFPLYVEETEWVDSKEPAFKRVDYIFNYHRFYHKNDVDSSFQKSGVPRVMPRSFNYVNRDIQDLYRDQF